MIAKALFAAAAVALACTLPVNGAGVIDAADHVPDCQSPGGEALDLDISLAVLTPDALCADLRPVAFRVEVPAPVAAPESEAGGDLVATSDAESAGDVVVPVARIVRQPTVVAQAKVIPVRATVAPALTASLPRSAAPERPRFTSDQLWMIGVYR
jgi:hypothetical protein